MEHYVVSLVRYMMTAVRLAGRGEGVSGLTGEKARGIGQCREGIRHYRLSTSAALLRGLHEVPAIVQFLREHGKEATVEIPADLKNTRADRVLLYRPAQGKQAEYVEMFTLNDLSCRLLELLTEPRPWQEAIGLLGPLPAGGVKALPGLLDTLLSKGVLSAA